MAILTALRPDEIERVTAAFGVDMVEAKGVLAGSVNTSFTIVDGRGRRFWLRVYEEQDHTGASREARLLTRLAAAGVSTPAPLPLAGAGEGDGRFVTTVRDKPVCLFPFVEGKHRCQRTVTAEDVASVGGQLARVHKVGEGFDSAVGLTAASRFSIGDLRSRLATLPAELPLDVADATRLLTSRLDDLASRAPRAEPLPLIHGDLFRDNVLFSDEGVTLLDFESASIGSAAFDLMVTLLSWCFGDDLNNDLCRALVAGYQRVRPLTEAEVGDLATQGQFACVRFATTRITDYELRPRGIGVYKDYRRFLARLAALERIGADLPDYMGAPAPAAR
jgi:homoserine kinase type II